MARLQLLLAHNALVKKVKLFGHNVTGVTSMYNALHLLSIHDELIIQDSPHQIAIH